jgi:hypothetical protein
MTEIKKTSLSELLHNLQQLEATMMTDESLSKEIWDEHFKTSTATINEKVDNILSYMDTCKLKAAQYSERAEELELEAKRWEKRYASLQEYTLWCLNAFPEGDMKGTDRKITKKLNPPSMICCYKTPKSFSNYVPDSMAILIDPLYLEQVTVWTLKTDELKEDLKQGLECNFAHLERKESLQIKVK